jgi:hypothetical protein
MATVSASTTVRYIKNGTNAVLYRLFPSTTAMSFTVDAAGAYQPAYIDVWCGYSKTDGDIMTTYPGTEYENLYKHGDTPYNILYRTFDASGVASSYKWAKDLVGNGSGVLRVLASSSISKVEFYLTSASSVSLVSSDNIVDTSTIGVVYAGLNGTGADYYELQPSIDIIGFTKAASGSSLTPTSRSITVYVKHISTSGTEARQAIPSGYTVRYAYGSQPATTSDGALYSSAITIPSSTSYSMLYLSLFSGETLIDTRTVPIIKSGLDGADNTGITINMQKPHGLFAMTYDGETANSFLFENYVTVQYGTEYETITSLTVSASDSAVGVHADASTGKITVELTEGTSYDEDSFDVYVTVKSEHCSGETVGFVMQGVRCGADGEWYELEPSSSVLTFGVSSDGSYTPGSRTIWCGYAAYKGSNKTSYDGTVASNVLQAPGGTAPYNIFLRTLSSDGTTYSAWMFASGYAGKGFTVVAIDKMQGVEFAFSDATSTSAVSDDNIYDRHFIPCVYEGAKGDKGSTGDKGTTGAKGDKGDDGKGISSTTVRYATSSSGTSAPTIGWLSSVPTVLQGYYLWTRTIIVYTDGTQSVSYSVARNGTDGESVVWADIDNEMISVSCDSDGVLSPATQKASFSVHLYDGVEEKTIDSDYSITISGKSISTSTSYTAVVTGVYVKRTDNTLSFNILSVLSDSITSLPIAFTYGDYTRVCTLTINKIIPGKQGETGENAVLYEIQPSSSVVKVDSNGTYTPTEISVALSKYDGVSTTSQSVVPTGYVLYYGVGTKSASLTAGDALPTIAVKGATGVVTLTLSTTDGVTVDKETIPIVVDGAKGDSVSGAVLRVRNWSDIPSGGIVYSGAAGETFLDVVLVISAGVETYWRCKETHEKSSNETPSVSSSYWQTFADYTAIATDLLLAKDTKIDNLYVDKVSMYKDGIEVVRIADGDFKALTGELQNVKIVSGNSQTERVEIDDSTIAVHDDSGREVSLFSGSVKKYDDVAPMDDILVVPQIANDEFKVGVPKANGLSSYNNGSSYSIEGSTIEGKGFLSASGGVTINSSTASGMNTSIADNDKDSETPMMFLTGIKSAEYNGVWVLSVNGVSFSSFGRSSNGGQQIITEVALYLLEMDTDTKYKTATELVYWSNTSNVLVSTAGKYKYTHESWGSTQKIPSIKAGKKYRLGVKIDSSDTKKYADYNCSYYVNITWTLDLGFIYMDSYHAAMFKNGLALTANKDNYLIAMADVDSGDSSYTKEFVFDVKAGGYGLNISKTGWEINSQPCTLPLVIYKGVVSFSGSTPTVSDYYNMGSTPTVATKGNGQIWFKYGNITSDALSDGNCSILLTPRSGTGYVIGSASVVEYTSSYITINLSKMDSGAAWSLDYCNFEILICKL